mmetsp:Transcript_74687/g.148449  ORF Transcript_74687/g.148449 Transcript_74687/m.148449 type:complete len:118 (-) Transcript_74687:674-1027(-)
MTGFKISSRASPSSFVTTRAAGLARSINEATNQMLMVARVLQLHVACTRCSTLGHLEQVAACVLHMCIPGISRTEQMAGVHVRYTCNHPFHWADPRDAHMQVQYGCNQVLQVSLALI